MQNPDAVKVAQLLDEYGRRTALYGGNPYRAKAYLRAAENIALLADSLDDLIRENRLKQVPGVGDAIADIIKTLHQTGSHPRLEKMRQDFPVGLLELVTLPGIRADKIVALHKQLGVSTLEELEEAANNNRIAEIKGLGPALQRKVQAGIELKRTADKSRHVHRATALLSAAERTLVSSNADISCVVPGDLRRGNELVSDLVLVAERSSVKKPAMRVYGDLTVHFSDATHFGAQLLAATGSKKHLDELRHLAAQKGLTLKPNGLFKAKKLIASRTEQEIYQALGLGYIEPELREGLGEIDLAILDQLPKLVRDTDIQGVLHVHTDASDGVNTLEEMAESTRERGYSYLGLTDHSKSAHYAGGLSIAEVREQQKEIDRLNADYAGNFRIFKGIESDILPDGSLDYPDEVLESFDFVIASVHGQFRKDRAAQTERILRAVANPRTTILGHMTGRQLLRRAGYEVDVERVLAACAQHGVGVEINANPWRLDLDWRWHRRALELGCSFSIDPDAHSTDEIDLTHWGVEMARKGSIPPERVLNCLNLKDFQAHLLARKAHR